MELSIIIVNYNVKYFLEQCLHSVQKAIRGISAEVWVVDNFSSDGSLDYLKGRYPAVQWIENKENIGFGAANNQALLQSQGDWILFLNPDTLLPEDCLSLCLAFIQNADRAGAMGIRMLDGSGQFLPESKRAFPSPITAFFKLMGLSALFPQSALFNRYSLGHLDPLQNHRVDVLAGAFMLVKKSVLDQVGAFDQRYFMYAEDIDLSYRIQKAGYTNYYFAGSSIIHFKGESTRKGSLNYVLLFYAAMLQFVQKNYRGLKAGVFGFFIQLAILLRGGLAAIAKIMDFLVKLGKNEAKQGQIGAESMVFVENPDQFPAALSSQNQALLFLESERFSWKQILELVEKNSHRNALFRFRGSKTNSIVGSDSKETGGEALAANTNS